MHTRMNRWQAFAIHLACSTLVAGSLLAVLYFLWYPGPLFVAGGMVLLAALIVGIDIVLGPLLTLLVFKPGKPSLKFDLAVIVLLQLSALMYGINVATQSRPAWLVASPQRFTVVHANELESDPTPNGDYARPGWTGARLVAADLPTLPEQRNALTFAVLGGAPDIEYRPGLYRPYEEVAARMHETGQPLSRLIQAHPDAEESLRSWLAGHGEGLADTARYHPLFTRTGEIVMFLGPDGALIGPYPLPAP